ncbi:hypothetical protein BGZ52_006368 [Haplosporangium bisporale]|nr:hypothetical protein BGZ52_006368 [Haplosporangium bisporale]
MDANTLSNVMEAFFDRFIPLINSPQPSTPPPTEEEQFPQRFRTFDDDPQIRIRPADAEYTPNREELALVPALNQQKDSDAWFRATMDEDERRDSYRNYPKHSKQNFDPPTVPQSVTLSKGYKEVDASLVKIQRRVAHLTRPLDSLVHEGLRRFNPDDELMHSVLEYAQFVRQEYSYLAGAITELRTELLEKDRSVPKKEKSTALVQPADLAKRIKDHNSISTTLAKANNNNNHGNNNYGSHNNRFRNRNNNNNQYSQGQQPNSRGGQHQYRQNSKSGNNNNNNGSNSNRSEYQGNGQSRGLHRGRSQSRRPQTQSE